MEMKQLAKLLRDNPPRNESRIQVRAAAGAAVADVYLYDIIDSWFGISAKQFAETLNAIDAPTINLHINSPGGDVFDARAIATTMRNHPSTIVARIDGLAASAASTVAMAADSIVMAEGTFLMIHRAWTFAFGNTEDFINTAAVLEKIDGEIAGDYARRMDKPVSEVLDLMSAETWYTADEAFLAGLADKVVDRDGESTQNAANWNLSAYDRVPKALTEQPQQAGNVIDIVAVREANARRLRLIENVAH